MFEDLVAVSPAAEVLTGAAVPADAAVPTDAAVPADAEVRAGGEVSTEGEVSSERELRHYAEIARLDAQVAALQAVELEAAGVFLRQGEALLAMWESTPASGRVGRDPHVLGEAGLALGLHPLTVDHRLSVATTVREQPLLRELLLGGRLGVPHALVAVDEIDVLDDAELAGRVLTAVLARDGRLGWTGTPSQLRTALRRAVIRLDPAGAACRRAKQQAYLTGVRLRALPDGLASWTATGAAGQLLAADTLLDVMSRPAGPDDPRSRGQRQLDALLVALAAKAGSYVPVELQLEIPVQPAGPAAPGRAPEPVVIRSDLTPELLHHLTGTPIPTATPADADADADDATVPNANANANANADADADADAKRVERQQSAGPAENPAPAADTTPADIDMDIDIDMDTADAADTASADTAPADTAPADTAPGTDTAPATDTATVDGTSSDEDGNADPPVPVGRPWASRRRHQPHGGVPELVGAGPVDPGLLAELLTDPHGLPVGFAGLTVRRVCVDPTGQVIAVDRTAQPLARLGTGAPSPAGLLGRLLADLPGPPPDTDAHQPTAAQTRLVQARDWTCRFPGCPRRATRCDLDHRIRHPDGPTSTSNLHPLCRGHHRLKHDGWTCLRHPDGTTTWTSPRGQRHRTQPP